MSGESSSPAIVAIDIELRILLQNKSNAINSRSAINETLAKIEALRQVRDKIIASEG